MQLTWIKRRRLGSSFTIGPSLSGPSMSIPSLSGPAISALPLFLLGPPARAAAMQRSVYSSSRQVSVALLTAAVSR